MAGKFSLIVPQMKNSILFVIFKAAKIFLRQLPFIYQKYFWRLLG